MSCTENSAHFISCSVSSSGCTVQGSSIVIITNNTNILILDFSFWRDIHSIKSLAIIRAFLNLSKSSASVVLFTGCFVGIGLLGAVAVV
jgi:hypothetical protein